MLRATTLSLLALAITVPAWAGDTGQAKTEELIEAFKSVTPLPEEGALTADQRAANKTSFARLDGLFDFDTLTTTAIEPHKASVSDAQITEYKKLFREMVRLMAYPNAGQAFGKAEYSVTGSAAVDGGYDTDVEMYWEEQDLDLELTFHWRGSTPRVVDVSFDGDSLVKDYQAQFGRIINQDGADEFVARLQKKHTEIQEKRGGVL